MEGLRTEIVSLSVMLQEMMQRPINARTLILTAQMLLWHCSSPLC